MTRAGRRPPLRPAFLESLRGYTLRDLGGDATAGLVVGAVAIPLAIAFAIASGASPANGLVTVVVAGAVAAAFGGSRFLVTGPTGAFVVVLASIVAEHGLAKLLVAVVLAGVLLVAAGLARLGTAIKFIPYPVTVGFTAGIAVVILAGQMPDLLGVTLDEPPSEPLLKAWESLAAAARGLGNAWAFALAVATVACIQAVKRWAPRVPGPVVALVLFTALVQWVGPLAGDGGPVVATVGDRFEIPRGLPPPQVPEGLFSLATAREMLPSAITIAILGAIESLLAAVVADGMTRRRHDSNMELVGQGLANIASPFFGGIAATGAIARTAASVQNGARTPLAALVHVAVVAAVLYLLAPLASLVPFAVLAGILAVVAWNMSERHHFAKLLRMPRGDAGVLLVTFALTVAVDLTVAVAVGLVLAVAVFLQRMGTATRVGALASAEDLPAAYRFTPQDVPAGALVYSIDGPVFFGAVGQFQETMSQIAKPPKVVVLRMRDVHYLDATGLNALEAAVTGLQRQGCRVMLSSIQAAPLDLMQRSGSLRSIGDGNLFRTTPDALAEARRFLAADPAPAPAPASA